jgi:adenylate kinase family enzyme
MLDFPIFNSKALSNGKTYDLSDPVERKKYFDAKLGTKIDDVKVYLEKGSFIGYLLAKKLAGKGTYSKMLEEILGSDRFAHISIGDVVRFYHQEFSDPFKAEKLKAQLSKIYRGYMSIDDAIAALLNRSQDKVSVPTEFLLALLKLEIDKIGKKALFIDGLPRSLDQISYSLYFRELINYRDDPDFFVLIDAANSVIDARIKNRVVCPRCTTSKNLLFNKSKYVKIDPATKQVQFICDNTACSGCGTEVLIAKEGDSLGAASIADRLKTDEILMKQAFELHGIPRILVRGSIPLNQKDTVIEDYEVKKMHEFKLEGDTVSDTAKDWAFEDDSGVLSCETYPAVHVVNIFLQLHKILLG